MSGLSIPMPEGALDGLGWFRDHRGQVLPWALARGTGALRASSAKAIYKPEGQPYALSIRIMAGGQYPNVGPLPRADGTWVAGYHQEGNDPAARDRQYTNVALLANIRDQQPVGVLRQTAPSTPEYEVLGVALPVDWVDGLFVIEGPDPAGRLTPRPAAYHELLLAVSTGSAQQEPPGTETRPWFDARARAITTVVQRQGQGAFRETLLQAYCGRCAVTGEAVRGVLDAAHIDPYLGPHSNSTDNGLLLRTDLHALFDLGQLALEPKSRRVMLHPALLSSGYGSLHGLPLAEPAQPQQRPAQDRLQRRLRAAGLLAPLPPA